MSRSGMQRASAPRVLWRRWVECRSPPAPSLAWGSGGSGHHPMGRKWLWLAVKTCAVNKRAQSIREAVPAVAGPLYSHRTRGVASLSRHLRHGCPVSHLTGWRASCPTWPGC